MDETVVEPTAETTEQTENKSMEDESVETESTEAESAETEPAAAETTESEMTESEMTEADSVGPSRIRRIIVIVYERATYLNVYVALSYLVFFFMRSCTTVTVQSAKLMICLETDPRKCASRRTSRANRPLDDVRSGKPR